MAGIERHFGLPGKGLRQNYGSLPDTETLAR